MCICMLLLSRFSRVRLCDPIDGSPPGSPVPGTLQARVLEWGAVAFSTHAYWCPKENKVMHSKLLALKFN